MDWRGILLQLVHRSDVSKSDRGIRSEKKKNFSPLDRLFQFFVLSFSLRALHFMVLDRDVVVEIS